MPPNVLILVMDAARAANFGCYGHHRDTSPNTDTLAENGRRFKRAVPPAPATFDSVTSVLSGTYPCEHQSGRAMQVNTSQRLLPEVLSSAGYTTGFATSSPGTTPAFGYGAGIDEFYDITNKHDGMNVAKFFEQTRHLPAWRRYLKFARRAANRNVYSHLRNAVRFRFGYSDDDGASEVTSAAKEFISTTEQPWFLYLHYTETHLNKSGKAPYAIPEDALTKFADGDITYDDLQSVGGEVNYTDDQVDRQERLYDGAIHYLDRQVGALTDYLRDAGELDETLVVVTSDHGEVLGTQGYLGHGTLDEPVLQVPLVMHGPGVEPEEIDSRVNLLGLYKTVAELAGGNPDIARGSDLLGDEFADPVLCQDYTETWDWAEYGEDTTDGKHAFYDGDLKLIATPDENRLYDIVADPAETTDLSDVRPDQFDEITQRFTEFVDALPNAADSGEARIDEQTEARLQELGYID